MKKRLIFLACGFIFACSSALSQQADEEFPQFQNQEPPPVQTSQPIQKTGDSRISLNLKSMDVLDVLKMFSGYSGMNIVVGKNVSGRVTLFLKDVDVWDAFEIILLANELAYERKGDIIHVLTQRDYEMQYGQRSDEKRQAKVIKLKYSRSPEIAQALTQIKSNLGKIVADAGSNTLALVDTPEKLSEMEQFIRETDLPVRTDVHALNYAQADKLLAKIQDMLTKNVGSARIDERTNKIAVTDYPEKLEEIARVISAFDERNLQVLIDAQIIEIKPEDEFKMGVDWDYWIRKNFRLVSSLPSAGAVNTVKIGTAAAGANVAAEGEYKGIVDILRTIGDLKILSSPRIMALNNQEARILVGSKEPYASQNIVSSDGSTVTSETINFVDVGIKLYVTPVINREGFVTMKIRPEVSSTGTPYTTAEGEEIPVVSTSEAETSVMVKDGVTIIIGGLTKDQYDKEQRKIPVLGDIPVLDLLFKRTAKDVTKTELVILLTPHIMSGERSFTDINEVEPREGGRAFLKNGELTIEKKTHPPEERQQTLRDYYDLILARVRERAISAEKTTKKGWARVTFKLTPEGILLQAPAVAESSDPELSPLAVAAVNDSAPFPPFPDSLGRKERSFEVEIHFEPE